MPQGPRPARPALRIALLAGCAAAAAAAGPADVPAKHWARAAVEAVTGLGLMELPGGKFAGDQPVTRQSLAHTIREMIRVPELAALADGSSSGPPPEAALLDVAPASPGYDEVVNALGSGLMTTAKDRFEPARTVSRFDLALLLGTVVDYCDSDASGRAVTRIKGPLPPMADVPAEHPARAAIEKAVAAGLITGIDGRFLGDKPVNRYQLAQTLKKVLDLVRETRGKEASAAAAQASTGPVSAVPAAETPPAEPPAAEPAPAHGAAALPAAGPSPTPASPAPAARPPARGDMDAIRADLAGLRARTQDLLRAARELDESVARLETRLAAPGP